MGKTKTRVLAWLATASLVALSAPLAVGLASSASANDTEPCVPSQGTQASFSDWSFDHFTDWQTSDVAPADPDGQSGDDNPLNLSMVGDRDEKTVVDSPAVAAQHYALKGSSGIGKDDTPPTPAQDPSIWQANTKKEPHLNNKNITWVDGYGVGLHYASHKSSGKRDWFYFQPAVTEVTHVEYRWEILTRTYTPGTDGNTCLPATAGVQVTAAECDNNGSAVVADLDNAVLVGTDGDGSGVLSQEIGDHVANFQADSDALFDGGVSTLNVSYSIQAAPGGCDVTVNDATASVGTTPATCSEDGSASYDAQHATLVGVLDSSVGNHTAHFVSDSGHTFKDNNSTELSVSYTVAGATGDCPQPPKHHNAPPKHHSTLTKAAAPVPTSIPAGLSGTENDETGSNALALFAYGFLGTLILVGGGMATVVAVRRRGTEK